MKTDELTGAALDWAVAKCEGFELNFEQDEKDFWINRTKDWQQYYPPFGYLKESFSPSCDWSQGGEVIERERIAVAWNMTRWVAWTGVIEHKGETPLIAAMRCYVSGKLGDEVDVPEEVK